MRKAAHDLTLAEAVDQIYFGASCNACHEVRRVDLHKLLERFGPDFLVKDINKHLRCSKCGRRGDPVTTLWKSATTTERMMGHWK